MSNSPPYFPQANDPLGDVLHQLRLDGSLYCRSELSGDWSISMPAMAGKMMFHIITSGSAWLLVDQGQPIKLEAGSLVLLPHGKGHVICRDPDISPVPLFEAGIQRISPRYEVLIVTGEGETTELTCGVMDFNEFAGKQLLKQLPSVLHVDQMQQSTQHWLQATLQFMGQEAKALKPGGETIMTHLADIIVIQAIRHWMESTDEANQGWIGALRNKHIGIAMRAIHHHPDKNWTVASLAKECGMSRSGFSAHFKRLVGNSAKHYLTEWRMNLAYQRLKQQQAPLIVLAEELGYQSEAAFSRAFKRIVGISPGKVQKEQSDINQYQH